MASEMVDPIDLLHPPPSWAVPPDLHVLHGVNAAYKLQDLVHQPGLERGSKGMPDQCTTCAATQGIIGIMATRVRVVIMIGWWSEVSVYCSPCGILF